MTATEDSPDTFTIFISNEETVTMRDTSKNNSITFLLSGQQEMLRISPEGFWVRGVQIEQDEQEAARVYEAFSAFLHGVTFEREYRACLKNRDEEHLAAQAREDLLRKQLMQAQTANQELRDRLNSALMQLGGEP